MPTMPKKPVPEVVAVRCSVELVAKLDELVVVLGVASLRAVKPTRSDVARAALEAGADVLLLAHREPDPGVP
jgi:hypothetical protein